MRVKPYSPRWRPGVPGTDSCRAYYLLHEGAGNPVGIDPNAITMTLFGASWGAGPFGAMLDFNAAESDRAKLPNTLLTSAAVPNGLSMTALFTLPVMPASNGRLWEMGDQNFEVNVYNDGHIRVAVTSTTYGTSLHNTAAGLVTTGTTYALTQILRRSTGDSATKELYLNGSSVLSVSISFDQFLSGLAPTGIASRDYGAVFLDLDLHALVVQETALTPTQVSALHTDLSTGTFAAVRPSGLTVVDFGAALAGGGAQSVVLPRLDSTATLYAPSVAAGEVNVSLPLLASTAILYQPAVAPSATTTTFSGHVPRLTSDALARDLAGWWPMAPGTADVTSYGREPGLDGTLVGGATHATGRYGGALDFPTAGRADCGTGLRVDRLSVAAWVYPTATGSIHTILAKRDSSTVSWMVRVQSGTLRLLNSSVGTLDSGLSVPTNQWSFVGATYDGTTATFFVNGRSSTASGGSLAPNSAKVSIGGFDSGTTTDLAWSGKIGQVAAWDRLLSVEEFRALQADYRALWRRDEDLIDWAATRAEGGQSISLPRLDSTAVLYAPSVAAGEVNVSLPLLASTATLYQPALSTGGVGVVLPRLDSMATLYAPSIVAGGAAVDLPLLASTATLYQPAVAAGAAVIDLLRIESTATLHLFSISGARRGPTRFASTASRRGPDPRSATTWGA